LFPQVFGAIEIDVDLQFPYKFPKDSLGFNMLEKMIYSQEVAVMEGGLIRMKLEPDTSISLGFLFPFAKRFLVQRHLKTSTNSFNDLKEIYRHPGSGFAYCLQHELMNQKSTSDLWKKILKNSPDSHPKIIQFVEEQLKGFTFEEIEMTDLPNQLEPNKVYVPQDLKNSNKTGIHKCDLIIPYWKDKGETETAFIYIQCADYDMNEKDHDKKIEIKSK